MHRTILRAVHRSLLVDVTHPKVLLIEERSRPTDVNFILPPSEDGFTYFVDQQLANRFTLHDLDKEIVSL